MAETAGGPPRAERRPLDGVRVVEVTSGLSGRTAARLLADLGADVIRLADAIPGAVGWDPETLSGDRGKRFAATASLPALLTGADVFLTDLGPSAIRAAGLDEASLRTQWPDLVHVWLPPYGTTGRWSDLPPDPLLLAAISGYADHFPASEERPVLPVTPAPTYLQGLLGATAAVTALAGRLRGSAALGVTVTGLHACAGLLVAMAIEYLDGEVIMPKRGVRTGATFRLYLGGDGNWFFMGALSPEIFLRALDVVGRMDVMVLPGVDGEFMNVMRPEMSELVGQELQKTFLTAPAATWIARLNAGEVPAAPVLAREDWLANPIVVDNQCRHVATHPDLGPVLTPGVPILLDGTAPVPGWLPTAERYAEAPAWHDRDSIDAPAALSSAADRPLPLAGLRVIDLTTFYAGPFAGAVLAEHGADVIKVESRRGDPYRTFSIPHPLINKRKRVIALDLHHPEGMAVVEELLRGADVLLDNFRPAIRERVGLSLERLRTINPRLVHCALTAYGEAAGAEDLPGFDPVMQSLSGMVKAQGGEGEPIASASPVNDLGGGSLMAFGAALGLYVRARGGAPLSAVTSLAAGSTVMQSAELTDYAGRPPRLSGGLDFPGPTLTCRYHLTADGWIAIAARTPAQEQAAVAVVGTAEPEAFMAGLATRPTLAWVDALAAAGVPACPVRRREGCLRDEYLFENRYTEPLTFNELGRVLGMRSFVAWNDRELPPARAMGPVGCDTVEVLQALGYADDRIGALFASGAVTGTRGT